jgi:hypothetical protein
VRRSERVNGATDAADIVAVRALLESLSHLRLAVAAELSAAVGALEADRPDIAAQLIPSGEQLASTLTAQPARLGSR